MVVIVVLVGGPEGGEGVVALCLWELKRERYSCFFTWDYVRRVLCVTIQKVITLQFLFATPQNTP